MLANIYQAHTWARLWLGLAILLLVLMNHALTSGLLLLLLLMALLRLLQHGFMSMKRLSGLLRWFLPPIFLLHALFTPGALVFPGLSLPLTYEGIQRGLWICVHFTDIFLAAMMLGSMLSQSEWLQLLAGVPGFQQRAGVHAVMLAMMHRNVSGLIAHVDRQWRLRRRWMNAPGMLIIAMRQALCAARMQAHTLWLRWPGETHPAVGQLGARQKTAVLPRLAMDACLIAGGLIALAMGLQ